MTDTQGLNEDDGETGIEADRLEGFPHPRETTNLIGHEDAENLLLGAFGSSRLHHAWLITGPEGIGKATLAYRFARFVLAAGGRGDGSADSLAISCESPTFRQVAALSHPNLLVLRRRWQAKRDRLAQDITVGDVRSLRSFLGNTAGNDGWRVIIVDRADDLNANAANALLKALEEPPPRCVFMLISQAPGRLAVTIRSRCRSLALAPLAQEDLLQAISGALTAAGEREPDADSLEICAGLAQGSVGDALQLITQDGLALYEGLYGALNQLPELDYRAVHKFADKITARGAEARFELAMSLLGGIFTRLIRHAATGSGALGDEAQLCRTLMHSPSLARWAELWETIQRVKLETAALNLDRKNFVLTTFFRIEEAARLEMGRGA